MSDLTNVVTPPADIAPDVPPIMIPEKFVAAVFDPFKRKLAVAKRAAAKVDAYDITTTAGMAQAKDLRASFRDIRTALENERKARKAPIIAAGKLLDSRAAELTAEIEPLEGKYDREIKAEEQRKEAEKQRKLELERARVEAIENRIANIRNAPGRVASAGSATINQEINQWTVLRLDPADYQEYLEDALTAVNTTLEQLETLLAAANAREVEAMRVAAEREELARLRAEQEAREQAEREAAAERERLARIEREAAAAREADLQRQLAEMKAAMEAQARAANPPPAAPPADIVPVEQDHTGIIVGAALVSHGQPGPDAQLVEKLAAPITVQPQRPTDGEIIELLAVTFQASEDTVTGWLVDLVKGLEA